MASVMGIVDQDGPVSIEGGYNRLAGAMPSRLPRYTSYPTAANFKSDFDCAAVTNHFHQCYASATSLSLYVHVPFCPKLCYFCACNKVITSREEDLTAYLGNLRKELLLHSRDTTLPVAKQIHLGGGSPSYLSCEQLIELNEILNLMPASIDTERSIEVDCRTLSFEKIALLHQLGFRRFSIGVQDLDPDVQTIINRIQPQELLDDMIREMRRFEGVSINFDLIYGLPGQSEESVRRTMSRVVEWSPDRIALYGYADCSDRIKVQRVLLKHGLPTPIERVRFFEAALQILTAAEYSYIGLDHFAKSGDELSVALNSGTLRRNFMGYTTQKGDVLLGIGPTAISDTAACLTQNAVSIEQYEMMVTTGRVPIEKVIWRTDEDVVRAYCIESLMCKRKLSLNDLCRTFGDTDSIIKIFEVATKKMAQSLPASMVLVEGSEVIVPPAGALFLRYIASFFDAYLGDASPNRFSAAV